MTCTPENVTVLLRGPFFSVTGPDPLHHPGVSLALKLEEDVRTTFSVSSLTIILIVKKVFAPARLTLFFHNPDFVFKVSVRYSVEQ